VKERISLMSNGKPNDKYSKATGLIGREKAKKTVRTGNRKQRINNS